MSVVYQHSHGVLDTAIVQYPDMMTELYMYMLYEYMYVRSYNG